MKSILMALVAVVLGGAAQAGFVVTIENDIFCGTDNNYSHGTEMEWVSSQMSDKDGPFRIGYGINQIMYTPIEDSLAMPAKSEHPWCGTLTAYRETWIRSSFYSEEVRTRIEIGVLGPASLNERSQRTVHRMINNDLPVGWDNQMPNEPMVNLYQDRYHLLWNGNLNEHWGMDVKGIYGGTVGTTFINGRAGFQWRAGYNIPNNSMPGGIEPKAIRDGEVAAPSSGFFVYLMSDVTEMVVLHNATCGSSFFRDREPGQERTLEPLVNTYRYGIVIGYNDLSFTYLIGHRSNEFDGQADGGMDWGMLRLEYLRQF